MSWISDLFSSSVANVVESVGEAVDRIVTNDEERGEIKIALEKELNRFKTAQLDALAKYDQEITKRHASDMGSDSWLAKNIRPLALAFLTVGTVALAYLTIFGINDPARVAMVEPWLGLLQVLLVTVYSFYFGSRGMEKVQAIRRRPHGD